VQEHVGIIVGGGPAPGINGVVSAATIEAVNSGKRVFGVSGGFRALLEGKKEALLPLTIQDVSRIHNKGGSILRTSRDGVELSDQDISLMVRNLEEMGIRYLITIGGDGTLFVAQWIEKVGRGRVSVVHTPKTIDNDIPLPGGISTFGFQTARHVGVALVTNIMEDARTMGRWYFITTMGRHTGHLALGIGQASGATITLIPEEFEGKSLSLKKVADILLGAIIKRLSMGRDHGVAIVAEGIIEGLDLEELGKCEMIERDDVTGKIRLSEIQLARVLKHMVKQALEELGIRMTIVSMNIGYELRAADPIPYDVEYARSLGYGAIKYLLKGGSGATITVYEGHIRAVPFVEMLDNAGRVRIRRVDITSELYEVARKYMIRLEREDFEGERLERLCTFLRMRPQEFKERFASVLS